MIASMHAMLNGLGSVLVGPWCRWSVGLGIVMGAVLTAVIALLVYRATSNQSGIRSARNRAIAHLADIALYTEYPGVVFGCVGRSLGAAGRYLAYALVPLLVMIVPVAWLLIQCNAWFGWRGLEPGKAVTVTAELEPGGEGIPEVQAVGAVKVETEGWRIAGRDEVSWRVRAEGPGAAGLRFGTHEVRLQVGGEPARLHPERYEASDPHLLLAGAPAVLPDGLGIRRLEIPYPEREVELGGWSLHWIVPYLVLTLAAGLVLSVPLRVEL